ncbi:hypothetical protein PHYSODRAFT_508721 [Phytophthora sojae]|uniref:Uncharacterized protein n=1 Tax=Phytophthora sojae (strain P6497) TaxID=1094619 RepID=G4ZKU3_PHYSP|nr:hypothetical protein PHYSODRAFT_508721 [Phytophthora sojae]EGZ14539.1 hypothetical protein PHYSODRAFT_508721 [Phytophthora sojae]|eukprot:XP_009528288.1 hypothetical protein PHYSODRAFT_508721 [Phytophthora sojae]
MASPSPTTTTRARSIQTLDGYVSRGRAPPSSVPRDHATLQDFAAFLELRLKSQNVSLLRRVFADFLNEQEHTLVPLMRQGVSIITVFPVLRTNPQRRRQAQRLLAKPKSHLDPRGCVFLYLQYRAATRNMALLKHMFLEFVGHKEASLLRFVERGNEVISVIPFELPRVILPAPAPAAPAPAEAAPEQQLQLTRKMEAFEAQIPWEAVFGNLPLPFEEEKHPELAKKLHRFWHKHSRAVWERKFWAPMSRKMNAFAFNKRNNRQISAKNAFETIILAAYEQLGAAFFVRLDMQQPRHPGWWYRSPVVALFALQEVKGEDAVWDYVKNDALERFPDCKLPIPIKATNYGAVQNCHKSASESMWMANHPLTPTWLGEIAALKAKQQAHGTSGEEAGVSQPSRGPDREPENVMTVMDALGFT